MSEEPAAILYDPNADTPAPTVGDAGQAARTRETGNSGDEADSEPGASGTPAPGELSFDENRISEPVPGTGGTISGVAFADHIESMSSDEAAELDKKYEEFQEGKAREVAEEAAERNEKDRQELAEKDENLAEESGAHR